MVAGVKNIGSKVTDMFTDWARKDKEAQLEAVKRLGLPKNNTAQDRAKAMGFGDDVYHGTKADFDEFKPHKDSWSQALFTSPNPKLANKFASDNLSWSYENGGGKVLPLKIRGDVFDYENTKHVDSLIENNPKVEIGEVNGARFTKLGKGDWASMESDSVQKGIKELGFDGFNVSEGGVKNTGTYNPANIRSKFAHFNPKYAGVGAGSILSADLMADEIDLEYKGLLDE